MRILWIKSGLLHPVDFGGRIRTYHTLRYLRQRHRITYLALDDPPTGPAERSLATAYCDELIVVRTQQPISETIDAWCRVANFIAWTRHSPTGLLDTTIGTSSADPTPPSDDQAIRTTSVIAGALTAAWTSAT